MEEQIRKIAQEVYQQNASSREFTVSQTSFHTHNGTDSSRVKQGDVISGTTSQINLETVASETFVLNTTQNITLLTVNAIAANGLGQKASINGNAQLGNCFRYGAFTGSISLVTTSGGSYKPFLQSFSSTYLDQTDIAKVRVGAGVDYFIKVTDDTAAVVAQLVITKWTGTSITFESTLAANWYIKMFLSMS